jgi:hypothetical protein
VNTFSTVLAQLSYWFMPLLFLLVGVRGRNLAGAPVVHPVPLPHLGRARTADAGSGQARIQAGMVAAAPAALLLTALSYLPEVGGKNNSRAMSGTALKTPYRLRCPGGLTGWGPPAFLAPVDPTRPGRPSSRTDQHRESTLVGFPEAV